MKKIYTAALLLICLAGGYAQPAYNWAKQIGGSSTNAGHSVAVDDSGNVYTRGSFYGTTDFNPGPGVFNLTAPGGSGGSFISKLNAAGDFVWAIQIGGPVANDRGYGIAVDKNGFVYTTGYFSGTADFDPGPLNSPMTASGLKDIFVVKFDAGGNLIWAKRMGGQATNYGYGIAVDNSGNVYTTGWFSGTTDFDPGTLIYNLTSYTGGADIFVSKLDASGDFVWAKQMGGNSTDWSWAIALDANNNVYTTGYFFYTADFDPGAPVHNMVATGGADVFISKLDSAGNFVWSKQMGGTGDDYGLSLKADNQGNVYSTGYFNGTADFNPGIGVNNLTSSGLDDIFISKLDALGNFEWAKKIGGTGYDRGQSIVLDAKGSVYTTGYFQNTADFNPDTGTYSLTSAGSMDVFITELDTAGNFVCAGRMGGASSTGDIAWGIATDYHRKIYITGQFASTADFNPDSSGIANLTATGVIDVFIGKYSSCSTIANPLPIALFQADDTAFCSGLCIGFSNLSTDATSWLWQFPGAVVSSDTSPAPTNVCYANSGVHDVVLIVRNDFGTDTLRKANYITTYKPDTAIVLIPQIDTVMCSGDSIQLCSSEMLHSFQWNTGDTSSCTYAKAAGGYWLAAKDSHECVSESFHRQIVVHPVPSVSVSANGDTMSSFYATQYQWYLNSNAISGATTQIYIAKKTGYYSVAIVDSNGCHATSSEVYFLISGMGEAKEMFDIYPSSVGSWQVTVASSLVGGLLEVYDANGRLVFHTTLNAQRSVFELQVQSGIYFIRIHNDQTNLVKKLVRL